MLGFATSQKVRQCFKSDKTCGSDSKETHYSPRKRTHMMAQHPPHRPTIPTQTTHANPYNRRRYMMPQHRPHSPYPYLYETDAAAVATNATETLLKGATWPILKGGGVTREAKIVAE